MADRSETGNNRAIGELLKAQREVLGLTQNDIAQVVGYRNLNFVSMIESGRSNLPLAKIRAFVDAYQLDEVLALAIVKRLYPDVWELFIELVTTNQTLFSRKPEAVEELVEEKLSQKSKELNLERIKKYVTAI